MKSQRGFLTPKAGNGLLSLRLRASPLIVSNAVTDLKKDISVISGTALMLNIVIGAGALVLPGLAFKLVGDAAIYSWVACAVIAIPLLLVFVIMGQRYPDAGGVSHFVQRAFGNRAYVMASLIFLGAVLFGLPSIALTGGHYLASYIEAPPSMLGLVLITVATVINFLPTSAATKVTTVIASGILLILISAVVIGLYGLDLANLGGKFAAPLDVRPATLFMPFMMLFFAFTGWEVAAGISEEFKRPEIDFPRAMFCSFLIVCTLYFMMAFVVQANPTASSHETAFVSIVENRLGQFGGVIISISAALIILANLTAAIWAVSRMVFSLGREGVLPIKLQVRDSGSPVSSIIITASALSFAVLLNWSGLIELEKMLALSGQNFLILYGAAAVALVRLTFSAKEKLVAFIALLVVAIMLVVSGQTLIYPGALALLGWFVAGHRSLQQGA